MLALKNLLAENGEVKIEPSRIAVSHPFSRANRLVAWGYHAVFPPSKLSRKCATELELVHRAVFIRSLTLLNERAMVNGRSV